MLFPTFRYVYALDFTYNISEREQQNDIVFDDFSKSKKQTMSLKHFLINQNIWVTEGFRFKLSGGLGTVNSGAWSLNSGEVTFNGDGDAGFAWATGYNWYFLKDSWGFEWYHNWDFVKINSDAQNVSQDFDSWNTSIGVRKAIQIFQIGLGLRYSTASLKLDGTRQGSEILVSGNAQDHIGVVFQGSLNLNSRLNLYGNLRLRDEVGGSAGISYSFFP